MRIKSMMKGMLAVVMAMSTAALFNLSDTDREICLNMEQLSGREPDKDSCEFTELWSGEVLHSGKEALTIVVHAHGTKVFSVRQIIKILFRPVLLRSNTGYFFFELFMKVGAAGKFSFFCNNIHSPVGSFKKLLCLISAHGCNVSTKSLVKFLMKYIR